MVSIVVAVVIIIAIFSD